MSSLTVTWPGGIGNPVGERIPTSDQNYRHGGVGDVKAIQGGRRRKSSTRRNRKNRKNTRKNRAARKYRASTRRSCRAGTCA